MFVLTYFIERTALPPHSLLMTVSVVGMFVCRRD